MAYTVEEVLGPPDKDSSPYGMSLTLETVVQESS